jgi:glycosyltransferase involved in cell wall biosynthesis/GT2 family glycosyltransferase
VKIAEAPGHEPTISIIVNTCDRSPELRTLLRSLEHQDYPAFEVIVVLGPTHDDSLEMLNHEFAGRIHLVRCPEFNLSVSRNLGLAHAAGEIVAFIDDDAVPCRNWLKQLAEAYAKPDVAGVGGRTHIVNPKQGQLQFLKGLITVLAEQHDVIGEGSDQQPFVAPEMLVFPRFHGTNMSYRRRALLDINGFDENFEYLFDDADIGVRLGLEGRRLVQLEGAAVYHAPTSGRNRGKHPYDLNWFSWLRSVVYFALKNGGPTVGRMKSLSHALHMISTFFAQVDEAVDSGQMPRELRPKARKMLRRGAAAGLLRGLLLKRKIPSRINTVDREFKPFLVPESERMPTSPPIPVPGNERAMPLNDQPMRLCLLSVGYPPSDTHGVSRSTHTLALGLAELGHEVHVVTSGRRLHVTCSDGIFIHEVNGEENPRYHDFADRGYRNLYHWLNHGHAVYEVVESLHRDDGIQLVDSPLWGLEGLATAVRGDLPMAVRVVTSMKQIADVHGQANPENHLLGELERHFLTMSDLIISNSAATTLAIEQVYGINPAQANIGAAPYGMVPAPEALVEPLPEDDVEEPTVLFVGRLEKRKGILDLFEAIPAVLSEHPRAKFVIAGSDNSREDGFFAEHRSDYPGYFRSRHPEAVPSVEFMGFVDESTLEALYRGCDLFVAPSLYESFGLIFLEAMNWARPVIGCAAGGPEEIIVDGETGLLVPPENGLRLAEAIVELLSSPTRRREMGRAGRTRLIQEYSHLAMARGFERLYRPLVDRAGEGSGESG